MCGGGSGDRRVPVHTSGCYRKYDGRCFHTALTRAFCCSRRRLRADEVALLGPHGAPASYHSLTLPAYEDEDAITS